MLALLEDTLLEDIAQLDVARNEIFNHISSLVKVLLGGSMQADMLTYCSCSVVWTSQGAKDMLCC